MIFNNAVLVAAVLLVNQTHFSRVIFIKHAVIKNNESVWAWHNLVFAGIPNLLGSDTISFQIPSWCVMTEVLGVVGEVSQGVIGLGDEQELAVIVAGDSSAHVLVFGTEQVFAHNCVSPELFANNLRIFFVVQAKGSRDHEINQQEQHDRHQHQSPPRHLHPDDHEGSLENV